MYKNGRRVRLAANKVEGWNEETATIIGKSGKDTYVVQIDSQFIHDLDDDGLREVTEDQFCNPPYEE
jgi:hypothetical protein